MIIYHKDNSSCWLTRPLIAFVQGFYTGMKADFVRLLSLPLQWGKNKCLGWIVV